VGPSVTFPPLSLHAKHQVHSSGRREIQVTVRDFSPLERDAESTCSILRAIGNPHRLMILCRLSKREHSVGELENATGLGQSALSQHLARLRRDKLVMTRRAAQTIYYSLGDSRVESLLTALNRVLCIVPKSADNEP
jgi:DNA-binding transcriptional ArsR family regulator